MLILSVKSLCWQITLWGFKPTHSLHNLKKAKAVGRFIIHLNVFITLLGFVNSSAFAQSETFNRFSYTAPAGWKKNQDNKRVQYEQIDGSKFCQIYLWCMTDSKGSNKIDFDSDWQSLVANQLTVKGTPQIEKHTEDGWEITMGFAEATFQNTPFVAMLVTCTKGKESFSITSNFNDEAYLTQVNDFIAKIDVINNAGTITNNNPQPANNQVITNSYSSVSNNGITLSTTNFDDGWLASLMPNYVRVVKTGVEVRLYYPDEKVDKNRHLSGRKFEYHYWDTWLKPDFQSGQVYERPFEIGRDAILEAPVKYLQTNQQGYAALMLYFENGVCTPIVGFAPTKELLNQVLPNHDSFEKMLKYNEFAVSAADVVGKWGSSGGASTNYYNVNTGQYVGTNTAATSDSFQFSSNGTYTSSHSFYTSGGGAGKQDYNGKFTVNVWTMNLTNRHSNDPGEFWCKFEAVKGGRILHLLNKKFEGQRYRLAKQ
jgi:hypothetical protein